MTVSNLSRRTSFLTVPEKRENQMSQADLITFNKLAEDNLSRFRTKAERTAFLVGLSLGARETTNEERTRICSNLKALWGVEVPRAPSAKTEKKQVDRSIKLELDGDMLARMEALKCSI